MIKIMIVEDDPMVRKINENYSSQFESMNIVSSVSDIEEAKEYLLKNEVDLILLDVFLPSGNGLDFLKWIRGNEISSDVILITAENKINSINEAFRYGVMDYLVKPFTFERFEEAMKKYLVRYKDIGCSDRIGQEYIDKYITGINLDKDKKESKEKVLIRGLNIDTYNQIKDHIDSLDDSNTAEVIADGVGLARVTVRRYLDYMVKEGDLKLIRVYGKVGRPIHLYKKK